MTLWIILTLMSSAVAVLVSAPFLRRIDGRATASENELVVFRDQLKEVEREADEKLIDASQAVAARKEILSRALAAERSATPVTGDTAIRPASLAILVGTVVLGSVGLYAFNGRPELPSSLGAAEQFDKTRTTVAGAATPSGHPTAGAATVEEMIDRLALRLVTEPDDAEGWRMLGWSYFSTGRYEESVAAYARAVALRPGMAQFQASYGEAIVRSSQDMVTPKARAIFAKALELDTAEPRARFYLGLAKAQDGNKAAALEDWIAILKSAPPEEAWVSDLQQRVAELAAETGVDVSARLSNRTASKGPTPEQMRAAQALPQAQQEAMIRDMVKSLADRLEASPRDEEGWIRLMRSYKALSDLGAADAALRKAMAAFADGSTERVRIMSAAKELGVSP